MSEQKLLDSLYLYQFHEGNQYLHQALALTCEDPSYLNALTTRLYPAIGEQLGKTKEAIESGMRYALERFWISGNVELFRFLTGYERRQRPYVGEFLYLLTQYLKEAQEREEA